MILGKHGYIPFPAEDATHVKLRFPGPQGEIVLPVIREGQSPLAWTWNGDVDKPTLTPSIKTHGCDYVCHSHVNEGQAQFLDDCSHELKGQTVDMLDV